MTVVNGEMILAQARQGRAVPDWQVLPVRAGQFLRNMAIFGVAAVALVALLVALAGNPNYAVTPGSSIESDSVLHFWRTVDFIVGAVLVLACLAATGLAIRDFGSRHAQLLVLMPDGFVIQTGADARTIRAVSYAAVGSVSVSVNRGEYTISMRRLDGRGGVRVQLDGRFGPPKPIAQRITAAQARFASAGMRG